METKASTLPPRRRIFVELYLQGVGNQPQVGVKDRMAPTPTLNATQAARRAGYAHPKQQAYRLLKDPQVANAIADRMQQVGICTEQILLRTYDVATGDFGDFAEVFEQKTVPAALRKAKALGISHLIQDIRLTRFGIQLHLYDAHRARKLIGRRIGLW